MELFEEAGLALRGLLPPELGELHVRARRYGLKVWFGSETPPREHYEAQVIGATHVEDATTLAIEVGFHAEYPDPAENEAIVTRLLDGEKKWRRSIGAEAIAGPFLGRARDWRRISETWPDPDLGDAELATEVAARLADYVIALEPIRRAAPRRGC